MQNRLAEMTKCSRPHGEALRKIENRRKSNAASRKIKQLSHRDIFFGELADQVRRDGGSTKLRGLVLKIK